LQQQILDIYANDNKAGIIYGWRRGSNIELIVYNISHLTHFLRCVCHFTDQIDTQYTETTRLFSIMSHNNSVSSLLQKYNASTERLKEEDDIYKVKDQIKRLSKNQIGVEECKEDGLQFGINCIKNAEESNMGAYACKFTFGKHGVQEQETLATLLHQHRDCILCKSDGKEDGQYLEPDDLHNIDNGPEGGGVNKLSYCVRYLGEDGKMVKDIKSAIRYDNDALAYLAETMATSALRVLADSGHSLNRNYFACPRDIDGKKGKKYGVAVLLVDMSGLMNSESIICYNRNWQYPFGPNCRDNLFIPVVLKWLGFDGRVFPGSSKVVAVHRTDGMTGHALSKEEIERRREERRAEAFDIKVWQLFDYMQKTGFNPRSGEILQVYEKKLAELGIDSGLYDWYKVICGTKQEKTSIFLELTDYEKEFLSDLGIPIKQPEVLRDDRRSKKRAGIEELEAARKARKAARKEARKSEGR